MISRDATINAGLAIAGILVFLIAFEAGLRAGIVPASPATYVPPNNMYRFCEGTNDNQRFHPLYGWTAPPDSTYLQRLTTVEGWNRYTHNDAGFRDTFDSGNRSTAIILGDSFAYGGLAGDNETFPYLLDRWTPNWTFKSFAKGNYGTSNEVMIYRNVSDYIPHDLVVLAYYLGNDASDNPRDIPKNPQFTVEDGEAVLTRLPRNTTGESGSILDTPLVERTEAFLFQNTKTYRLIRPALKKLMYSLLGRNPEAPSGDELDEQLSLTEALVENIGNEAKNHGAALLIVTIPERGEVLPARPHHYPYREGNPYWDAQRSMLETVAANRSNVHTLNLLPVLRNETGGERNVYGVHDGHLDDYGYYVAADALHNWMINTGHIPKRDRRRFITGTGAKRCSD